MKTKPLKNYDASVGCEVYDVDWNSPEEIKELGKLIAEQCIVLVDEKIPTKTLHSMMTSWGDPNRSLVQDWVVKQKLQGRHWRNVLTNLGYTAKHVDKDIRDAVTMVSFKRDEHNRPMGLFETGELHWHSDQIGIEDAPRVIGLQSLSDSVNSQTEFLCTHDAFESLSSDMQTMVKELYCIHKWIPDLLCPGLTDEQQRLAKYNQLPLDDTETKLYSETVTGLSGIRFPPHTFNGFVGLSLEESEKIFNELKQVIFADKNKVYTHNWQDGQVMFMDQEITIHRRPTNISHSANRTMARVITYWNHLFPNFQPHETVRWHGKVLTHDDVIRLVDDIRKKEFELDQ